MFRPRALPRHYEQARLRYIAIHFDRRRVNAAGPPSRSSSRRDGSRFQPAIAPAPKTDVAMLKIGSTTAYRPIAFD